MRHRSFRRSARTGERIAGRLRVVVMLGAVLGQQGVAPYAVASPLIERSSVPVPPPRLPRDQCSVAQLGLLSSMRRPRSTNTLCDACLVRREKPPYKSLASLRKLKYLATVDATPEVHLRTPTGEQLVHDWAGAFGHWLSLPQISAKASHPASQSDAVRAYLARHHRLTPQALYILVVIDALGQQVTTPQALREFGGVARQTAKRQFDGFLSDGLIELRTAGGVALTELGRGVLARGLGLLQRTGLFDAMSAASGGPAVAAESVSRVKTPHWTLKQLRLAAVMVANLDASWTREALSKVPLLRGDHVRRNSLFDTIDSLSMAGLVSVSRRDHHRSQRATSGAVGELERLIDRFGMATKEQPPQEFSQGERLATRGETLVTVRDSLSKVTGSASEPPADRVQQDLRAPALLLLLCAAHGVDTAGAMTERVGNSSPSVTRAGLKTLTTRGLVDRSNGDNNRGSPDRYQISDRGREVLAATLPLWLEAFESLPAAVLDGSSPNAP